MRSPRARRSPPGSLLRGRAGAAALASLMLVVDPVLAQQGGGEPPKGGNPAAAPATSVTSVPQPVEALEGRPVSRIVLRQPVAGKAGQYEPLSATLDQLAQNQIRSAAGAPLVAQTVVDDISRLNRIGRFRTIRAEGQLRTDGGVDLIFTLAEEPVIQDVQVVGNRLITDQELLGGLTVISGTPVDRFQIDRGARKIEEMYREKGYYSARVEIDERALADSAIVLYRVIEGDRVRVTDIRFEGNASFAPKELRSQIKTTTFIPVIEKAPLDTDVLAEDVSAITHFYQDRGYRDARVGYRVQPSPNGREAIVIFTIDEGALYTLRSVRVIYAKSEDIQKYKTEVLKDQQASVPYLTPEQMRQIGKRAFDSAEVSGLMAIKPGDVYSEDKMRKSLDSIREAYGKLGYLVPQGTTRQPITVRVEPQTIRDEKRPEIDLLLIIEEGRPYKTGEVTVTGNSITKQQVILQEVQVRPDRPLDKMALDDTQRRLEEDRLFAPGSVRVTAQPPKASDPDRRDVGVEVEETNTGEFNIGAAFGSDAGVIGTIAIKQRNFDIANPPESFGQLITGQAFRGAGQTAELRLEPGTEQQTYSFTLTEPHLLETNYSITGTALYFQRIFTEYTEHRYGGQVGFGRAFGDVWRANLQIRNQWVSLSNVDPGAPKDIFDVKDENRISGVGIALTRNTTDSRYRPTKGSKMSFGAEQVGALGGDFDFTKLSFDYTTFFNIYESFLGYRTILKVNNAMSYIPQGQGSAPLYERYYLGGQSFRGFAYQGVSPRGLRADGTQTNVPVGGAWSFFLGAEINQPVYEDIVSLVTFVDTGTVEESLGFSEYRASVGIGARIYIRALSPVPLAFDFGFPILYHTGDRQRVFTFSVDVPY